MYVHNVKFTFGVISTLLGFCIIVFSGAHFHVHLHVSLSEALADRRVQDPVAAAVEHPYAGAKLDKIDNIRSGVAGSQQDASNLERDPQNNERSDD